MKPVLMWKANKRGNTDVKLESTLLNMKNLSKDKNTIKECTYLFY